MKLGLVDKILRAWDLDEPMPQWKRTAIICWRVIGIGFGLVLAYMMLMNGLGITDCCGPWNLH